MMLVSEMQVQKQVRKKAFTSLELILFQNQSFSLFDAKKISFLWTSALSKNAKELKQFLVIILGTI